MSVSKLGLRGNLALALGNLARKLSVTFGRGSGGVIGGRVALKVDPRIFEKMCAGKTVILITGTNGKSTTTKMTRKAVGALGEVASNTLGDNMLTGALTALMNMPQAPYAVIEVDEMHLPAIASQAKPVGFILLNLSRDQLDRVGEIAKVERRLRQAVSDNPNAFVVANCDDPLVASAAWGAKEVIWVSAGCNWKADSTSFPRTGTAVLRDRDSEHWYVADHPEYSRPAPSWWVESGYVHADSIPDVPATGYRLDLAVPGRANQGNAAQALAAAVRLGVKPEEALAGIRQVEQVAGRYAKLSVGNRQIRILLAKNPAGWQESLTMINKEADTVIVAVNGQIPDGKDLSWLWDVSFENLHGIKKIVACGERGADLAVRLRYADLQCELMDSPWHAVNQADPGTVDVLANYTAFRDFKTALSNAGLWREKL